MEFDKLINYSEENKEDYLAKILKENEILRIENQQLRQNQTKLIDQLQKADKYSDKIEWKLFWKTKDEIVNEIIQKKNKKGECDIVRDKQNI